jgi:hypothetical protein
MTTGIVGVVHRSGVRAWLDQSSTATRGRYGVGLGDPKAPVGKESRIAIPELEHSWPVPSQDGPFLFDVRPI